MSRRLLKGLIGNFFIISCKRWEWSVTIRSPFLAKVSKNAVLEFELRLSLEFLIEYFVFYNRESAIISLKEFVVKLNKKYNYFYEIMLSLTVFFTFFVCAMDKPTDYNTPVYVETSDRIGIKT